jgi:hypothetical protein
MLLKVGISVSPDVYPVVSINRMRDDPSRVRIQFGISMHICIKICDLANMLASLSRQSAEFLFQNPETRISLKSGRLVLLSTDTWINPGIDSGTLIGKSEVLADAIKDYMLSGEYLEYMSWLKKLQ